MMRNRLPLLAQEITITPCAELLTNMHSNIYLIQTPWTVKKNDGVMPLTIISFFPTNKKHFHEPLQVLYSINPTIFTQYILNRRSLNIKYLKTMCTNAFNIQEII